MPRSTGGPTHSRKRKRVLKNASGFRAASGTLYRPAIEFTRKAGVYAYRDRRQRKRHFRTLWITRLGAALRARGIHYNRFIPALIAAGIERGMASAYTFVLHFALWFPITALGAWYLAHEGIQWTDSLRAEVQAPEISGD